MAVHKVHKLPVVPPLCGSGAWSKGTFGWRGLGNHRNVTGMWILFFWGFYALSSMFISNPLIWSSSHVSFLSHFIMSHAIHCSRSWNAGRAGPPPSPAPSTSSTASTLRPHFDLQRNSDFRILNRRTFCAMEITRKTYGNHWGNHVCDMLKMLSIINTSWVSDFWCQLYTRVQRPAGLPKEVGSGAHFWITAFRLGSGVSIHH